MRAVYGNNSFRLRTLEYVSENYTRLEYLENTGAQYIDTGLGVSSTTGIDIKLLPTNPGADERFFGAYDNGIFLGQLSNKWRYGSTCDRNDVAVDYTNPTRVVASGTSWKFNDTTKTGSAIGNRGNRMLLFGASYRADSLYGSGRCRVYYCKIYDGTTLVRDFIPCIRKSDGKAGMYDLKNGVFYMNAGSGNFTAGPLAQLPSEYQKIEYIESTGTQYIDTNYIPKVNNCQVELDMMWMGTNVSAFETFAGFMYSTTSNNPRLGLHKYSSKFMFGANATSTSNITLEANTRINYKGDFTSGAQILYLNGEAIKTNGTTYDFSSNTCPLYIFARYCPNSMNITKMRLYNCKVFEGNNLVRCFIPCVEKSSGKIGLFDLIGKTFYQNAGTGTFTKGPASGNLFMHPRLLELPVEYQRVEFIQSSGTQWIYTGINQRYDNDDLHIIVNACQINDTSTGAYNFGNAYTQFNFKGYAYSSSGVKQLIDVHWTSSNHTEVIKVNGEEKESRTWGNSWDNNYVYLFNLGTSSGNYYGSTAYFKYWDCKIYRNNKLIRDFVPCYRKSDGVIGMYDKANGKFYTNDGTGTFTKGGNITTLIKI